MQTRVVGPQEQIWDELQGWKNGEPVRNGVGRRGNDAPECGKSLAG